MRAKYFGETLPYGIGFTLRKNYLYTVAFIDTSKGSVNFGHFFEESCNQFINNITSLDAVEIQFKEKFHQYFGFKNELFLISRLPSHEFNIYNKLIAYFNNVGHEYLQNGITFEIIEDYLKVDINSEKLLKVTLDRLSTI